MITRPNKLFDTIFILIINKAILIELLICYIWSKIKKKIYSKQKLIIIYTVLMLVLGL